MWVLRRGDSSGGGGNGEAAALRQAGGARAGAQLLRENEELRATVDQLRQKLAAVKCQLHADLWRWRPVGLPLIAPEWERRYFVLQGTCIRYYKSSRDLSFSPREEFSLLGCSVEWLGQLPGAGRLWVWTIVDPGGSVLLKLGSNHEPTARRWVATLEEAGCRSANGGSDDSAYTPLPTRHSNGQAGMLPAASMSTTSSLADLNNANLPAAAATDASAGDDLPAQPPTKLRRRRPNPLQQPGPRSDDVGGAAGAAEAAAAPPTNTTNSTAASATAPAELSTASDVAAAAASSPARATSQSGAAGHGGAPRRQAMLGSTPVHVFPRASYLSSERMWHEKHTGLVNLMAVILVSTHARLALENAIKYGWRLNPVTVLKDLTIGNPNIPVALCYPALAALAALALLSERLAYALMQQALARGPRLQASSAAAAKGRDGGPQHSSPPPSLDSRLLEASLFVLNAGITTATLAIPYAAILTTKAEPLAAGVLTLLAVVMWMKLVSFHHCCADLRAARRGGEVRPGERGSPATPASDGQALLAYPENLTPAHLAYFLAAPTLCYQVNYPQSGPIRWKWLARRVAELVISLTVLSIIVKQYMEPAIANSMRPLKEMDWIRVCERLLKLALPNTYCWLVMFYCLFHLWLNILAELLGFGDREFFRDWWNAPTLGDYWRLWNLPVHKWLLRHVYYPAIRIGLSRWPAMILVFLVSAVFHEVLLGVPLHCVRLWAFAGIMLQVPLIVFTEFMRKKLQRDEAGNIVFWLTFCVVGQPLSILLYAHDYLFQVQPSLRAGGGGGLLAAPAAVSPPLHVV